MPEWLHCMMRKYMEVFEMVTIVGRKVKAKVDDNLYGVRWRTRIEIKSCEKV